MPNSVSLYIDSIASDRQTAVLKESTSYHLQYSTKRMYVNNYKVNQEAEEIKQLDVVIVPNPPYLYESWTVSIAEDGWYRYPVAVVPVYDIAATYNQYDCVFATGEDGEGVYRLLSTNPLTGSIWSPANSPLQWEYIADPARLAYNVGEDNESANVECGIYEVILSPNAEYEYAKYLSSLGKEVCSVDCSLQNLEVIIRLATVIDGMSVRNDRSEMPAGERLARRSENIIQELNG